MTNRDRYEQLKKLYENNVPLFAFVQGKWQLVIDISFDHDNNWVIVMADSGARWLQCSEAMKGIPL